MSDIKITFSFPDPSADWLLESRIRQLKNLLHLLSVDFSSENGTNAEIQDGCLELAAAMGDEISQLYQMAARERSAS